ncbi:MAG: hypothetical protein R3338_07100 [Thermoanaerobaculia bacterium]|nr:hypothetical protein [Thermoanaerobaculia bacterium]
MTESCDGISVESSGSMSVVLVEQEGADIFLMSIANVALLDDFCEVETRESIAAGGDVVISGNQISGVVGTAEEPANLAATISGSSMSGSFSDEYVSGSFQVERISTGIGGITGDYTGTYTMGATCASGGRAEVTSPINISIYHSGMRLGGFATLQLPSIDTSSCTASTFFNFTFPLAASVSGSSFNGFIGFPSLFSVSGSRSGSTVSGSMNSTLLLENGTATGSFTVTEGAGGAPTIDSFAALPPTTTPNIPVTLVWSTTNASSVTIEPGVGSELPDGAVAVNPAETTTYTLTATGESGNVSQQLTVSVISTPEIVLTSLPSAMVQGTSAGGATTSYVLNNLGGEATSITLESQGDFFTQSPTSFTLEPGASQRITVTGLQQETGTYRGLSIPSGAGVPQGLVIPIQLLSVPTPDGPTSAAPEVTRIDVSAPIGSNPTGTATFRNTGEATIQGILDATVPWIIPQQGLIVVDPGETVTVEFTIDRANRPPNTGLGSLEGKLFLIFRTGPSGSKGVTTRNGAETSSTLVSVVDTSTPPVEESAIPALGPGEVALFVPGAGNVQGGSGLFFSDLSLANVSSQQSLSDIDLYYTSTAGGTPLKTTVNDLTAGTPIALADVVRTVFDSAGTLGSLQIRAPNVEALSVNANILLNTREEGRTFGNTIPALRSDRSVGAGGSFYLTGLKRTDTSHTNLFIQETSGGEIAVDIAFYDEAGTLLGERAGVQAGPFQLVGLFESDASPVLPLGAVSAVITSRGDSTGTFAAYATPVDRVSGDSWSLVDWNTQSAFSGTEEMVVPVAGALRGANNLNFRTDLAVINRENEQASGVLRYIPRPEENQPPLDQTITLGAQESVILEDVTTSLFGLDPTQFTLGYMKFIPQSGSVTVTSRNFATEGDDPGTFGTGVATQALSESLTLGDVRKIGGVRDSSEQSILDGVPGTFRSNFGLMETTGQGPVTVKVTVHYSFSNGTLAVARGTASETYELQPNQFLQKGRVSREILGPSRDDHGDFDNLQVDFAVVGGDGAAAVWVSSVENDTGDSILRTK